MLRALRVFAMAVIVGNLSNLVAAQDLPGSTTPPNCFVQSGVDICLFNGSSGDAGSLKITSGFNALWFGVSSLNNIVKFETSGSIPKLFTIPTAGSDPFGITVGPDKRIWFPEYAAGNVGAMTSAGVFTEYPLGFSPSDAIDITSGSDGNLYMATDFNGIVQIIPGTGHPTPVPLPDGNDAQPSSVTLGSDGNVWFLEANGPCFQARTSPTSATSRRACW